MKQVMTSAVDTTPHDMARGRVPAAAGSLIAALAASSCCILPVILFALGAGGAWIGILMRLAPLQPYFIAAAIVFLSVGYWLVYRSHIACANVEACRRPVAGKLVIGALASATVLVILAIAFKFLAPLLLPS